MKRYRLNDNRSKMPEDPDGEWVRYEDVQALERDRGEPSRFADGVIALAGSLAWLPGWDTPGVVRDGGMECTAGYMWLVPTADCYSTREAASAARRKM